MNYKRQRGDILTSVLFVGAAILLLIWVVSSTPSILETIKVNKEEYISKPINFIKDSTSLAIKSQDGVTNILLIGIGGENYISGYLADTIIVASLRDKTKTVHFFSIPRDLWVSDENNEFQKINEFYQLGGGAETPNVESTKIIREKISEIINQTIHYTAVINLEGVGQAVDMVEGVEIDGQILDGEEALDYIRDRSTPRGDFDRMLKQQKLLVALRQKVEQYKGSEDYIEELSSLYKVIETNIVSDVGILEFFKLYEISRSIYSENIHLHIITAQLGGSGVESSNGSLLYSDYTEVNGQQIYTLHPSAGYEDYGDIQKFIQETIQGDSQRDPQGSPQ